MPRVPCQNLRGMPGVRPPPRGDCCGDAVLLFWETSPTITCRPACRFPSTATYPELLNPVFTGTSFGLLSSRMNILARSFFRVLSFAYTKSGRLDILAAESLPPVRRTPVLLWNPCGVTLRAASGTIKTSCACCTVMVIFAVMPGRSERSGLSTSMMTV